MSRESNLETTKNRIYLPTSELYRSSVTKTGSGIIPAFNNLYDVWIDFNSTVSQGGNSLIAFINQHGFYDARATENPGNYLALFCSEAVLPGSQIQTSQVDGLRQGVSSSYAVYRRYPDITLTYYSQKDYYTNEVFNAWMEYISPTYLSTGGHGTSTDQRKKDIGSYRKLKYPLSYKCDIQITAFSGDILPEQSRLKSSDSARSSARMSSAITYHLMDAFPVNIVSAPLAYGDAELIKTAVTFKYDYYYTDRTSRSFDTDTIVRSDTGKNVRNPF
jgi:hypothetical protein